jgi:hypothetical protein
MMAGSKHDQASRLFTSPAQSAGEVGERRLAGRGYRMPHVAPPPTALTHGDTRVGARVQALPRKRERCSVWNRA